MADTSPPLAAPARPESAGELFRVFTQLAMQGFGGVLPVAQRMLVERQRWLDRAQFLELLSVAQVLPGPNIINMALIFGDRSHRLARCGGGACRACCSRRLVRGAAVGRAGAPGAAT